MPYALSGQSLADALSQSQKLAKQFGFGFSGAFVVGRSAAWAKLASPAATMAIPSLFIGSPAHGLNRPRRREPSVVAQRGFETHFHQVDNRADPNLERDHSKITSASNRQ